MDNLVKMTLHEAIQKVLREKNKPMSTSEIASHINSQGLYQRGDGNSVPASQISARVKNYPKLFKRLSNNDIALNNKANVILNELVFRMEDCIRGGMDMTSYLVHSVLFYVRFSYSPFKYDFFGEYNFEDWVIKHNHLFQNKIDESISLIKYNLDNTPIKESTTEVKTYLQNAFNNLDNHFHSRIWENFILKQINTIPENVAFNLFKLLNDYDFRDGSLTDEEFGSFFNEYLNSGNRSMRDKGISSTPEFLNLALSKLVNLKPNDVLVDPFAGFCGTIVKASVENQSVKHSVIAFDIVDEPIVIGQMNLISNGIQSWEYIKHDSLSAQINLFDDPHNREIADWVTTIPPFNTIIKQYGENKSLFPLGVGGNSTNVYIQSILHILKPGGKAIIVVPDGFLFNNDNISIKIREHLVENNSLKIVISLPPGVFHPFTTISTSVIILEKASKVDEGIFFLNLQKLSISHLEESYENYLKLILSKNQEEGISILVSKSDIMKNHYQLNANRYFSGTNELKDGFKSIRDLIVGNFSNPKIISNELHSDGEIPFVNNSNLSSSIKDCILDVKSIKNYVDSDLISNKKLKRIKPYSILCSKIGTNLRPTLVEEEAGFVTSANILVLEIDQNIIIPKYFISQLYEDYVIKQLESIEVGTSQTFVRVEDLMDVKVKVPTISEQKYYIQGLNISSLLGLVNEPESEYQVLKHIKHSYSQINDAIGSDIRNLINYIHQKAKTKETISLSDKVSARKDATTLEMLFERIIDAQITAGDLFSTIKNIMEFGQSEMHKEIVDINEFLKSEKKYLESLGENLNIMIFTTLDSESLTVEIDKNQFKELLRNLVVNACRHGYHNKSDSKNLVFEVVQEDDPSKITMNYYNDGMPLPDGFSFEDYKSFGKRYDSDNGTGLGGHLVALIISKHEGEIVHLTNTDFFPIPRENRALKVGIHFKITLPKS